MFFCCNLLLLTTGGNLGVSEKSNAINVVQIAAVAAAANKVSFYLCNTKPTFMLLVHGHGRHYNRNQITMTRFGT